MPTHMAQHFAPEELQGWEPAGPFSFTKGCQVMKIRGRSQHIARTVHEYGNLLYDLHADPAQETPLTNPDIEARMVQHMIRIMQEYEAPPEQYQRLGLVAEQVVS
jgi:hypothetical protein